MGVIRRKGDARDIILSRQFSHKCISKVVIKSMEYEENWPFYFLLYA